MTALATVAVAAVVVAALALAAMAFALRAARARAWLLRQAEERALEAARENRELAGRLRDLRDLGERNGRHGAARERDLFFQVSLDLLMIADPEGYVQQLNPAWERVLGYPLAEIQARPLIEIVHPEDREKSRAEWQRLRLGGSTIDFENRYLGRDGIYRWLSWRATSVAGEDRLYAVARDVSERKKLDQIKNDFISVVSHELRTPLTSIRGSLGLLSGGVVGEIPETARDLIDIAAKNSDRLVRLINDILDFEKVESGAVNFRFQRVDLAALLEQAVESNQAYAQPFNVRFAVTSALPEAWVWADPDRLLQVLANLLSNAAKFSPRGDHVAITLGRRDGRVVASVTDQGTGIPPDFHHRVFERFAQADASSTRQKGGTGLGLAISKTIVERHGGHIGFSTRPATGTTFFFDLPEWGQETTAVEAPTLGHRILVCEGAHVLHVEDDLDVQQVVATIVGEEATMERASSLAEARSLLAVQRFDLVILDLVLPDGSGSELLPLLGALHPPTPAVLLSALDVGEELSRQVASVLVKSQTSNRQLLDTIRMALARSGE